MAYWISKETIDTSTGISQYDTLAGFADAEDWSGFYAKIYQYTAFWDDDGNQVDSNVREWFRVASDANAGVGSSSKLIRDYTAAQVSIRLGGTLSEESLDNASDAIASSVWEFIREGDGELPDLDRIATFDAHEVVTELQGEGFDVDIEVWSGNLLFVGLGNTNPFEENLLDPGNSYDLTVALQSLVTAGLDTLTLASFGSLWHGGSPGQSSGEATGLLYSYIHETYGTVGSTSLLFQDLNRFSEGGIQAGRQGNVEDLITGGNDDNIIHAGGGDDIIVGSAGTDFVDGGQGTDFFDLSDYSVGVYFQVPAVLAQGSVAYSGHVTAYGPNGITSTDLFSIENIRLTDRSDNVIIEEAPSFQLLDAGGNSAWSGDTITFAGLETGAQIDLASGDLVIDGVSATAANFEDVFGSDFSDDIAGSAANNTLFGGDGADRPNCQEMNSQRP